MTIPHNIGIIAYADKVNVAVAQLDRVFDYESKGRGFESLQPRQIKDTMQRGAVTENYTVT